MSDTSRRKFLAVAGAGAAAGTVGLASGAHAAEVGKSADAAQETVVAYVKDHRSSELRLMVGEREVVVQDRDLVTRILNAAGRE
ncbi:MAG: twin-arginine translocation signal domain-containing protein [Nocardioides sp.]